MDSLNSLLNTNHTAKYTYCVELVVNETTAIRIVVDFKFVLWRTWFDWIHNSQNRKSELGVL